MIRKEIKSDGTFGGNYPFDIDYLNLPENLIDITKEQAQEIDNNLDKYRFIDGQITDISSTPEYIAEQATKRQEEFESNFFLIPNYGWYRKVPKGYSSAIESLNTVFNAVTVLQNLPAGYLTFYTAPDFTNEQQCTEDWLVDNSFKNEDMTLEQFALFYRTAITIWNTQEH